MLRDYKAAAFNSKGVAFEFDAEHEGHRVLNMRTGLPMIGRRIIVDEGTHQEAFVATGLY
eukprot:6929079-Ditylum_brightwellii.AAC.1